MMLLAIIILLIPCVHDVGCYCCLLLLFLSFIFFMLFMAAHLSYLQLGARIVPDELLPALILRVRRHQRRPLPPPWRVPVLRLKIYLVMVNLSPQCAARLARKALAWGRGQREAHAHKADGQRGRVEIQLETCPKTTGGEERRELVCVVNVDL